MEIRGQGCTSLALRAIREAQARELSVAWIDGLGTFCPATASVDTTRLTLIQAFREPRSSGSQAGLLDSRARPRHRLPATPALFAADVLLRSRAYVLLVLDLPARCTPSTSTWFRLARLAARAHTALLLLHPRDPGVPVGSALSGSASALLMDVALCPLEEQGPTWGEWAAPDFEVQLRRNRDGGGVGVDSPWLRLPARG